MRDLTVMFVSYNRPVWGIQSLEIIAQEIAGLNAEIIIADDNSNEATKNAYVDFQRRHKNVLFTSTDVADEDRRMKKARWACNLNNALSCANGKYIATMFDDDFYVKGAIRQMLDFTDERNLVFGQRLVKFQPSERLKVNWPGGIPALDDGWTEIRKTGPLYFDIIREEGKYCYWITIMQVMYKRELLGEYGYFPSEWHHSWGGDQDWLHNLVLQGETIYHMKDPVYVQRIYGDSMHGRLNQEEQVNIGDDVYDGEVQ